MTVFWSDLRIWNGSQQLAFEELCCQLLSTVPPAPGAIFIRKGIRDAGIEGYWQLPDGSEHGIQAKFFNGSPDEGQLGQIDRSVETALAKHPLLTKYTVCLPTDRDNPRIEGRSDFMQRWDAHAEKWKKWATDRGRTVTFEYCGESELCRLLAVEQNAGLAKFWFGRDLYSLSWFSIRKEESIAPLRDSRYLPDLHVDITDLDLQINALVHDSSFLERLVQRLAALLHECSKFSQDSAPSELTLRVCSVLDFARDLKFLAARLPVNQMDDYVSVQERKKMLLALRGIAEKFNHTRAVNWRSHGVITTGSHDASSEGEETTRTVQQFEEALQTVESTCIDTAFFLTDTQISTAVGSAVLITGEAGIGKSHYLASVVQQRVNANFPALLFHGEHFAGGPLLTQMRHRLGIEASNDEFLGALTAAAQSCRCRALLVIDALNEADDKKLWRRELPSFLAAISQHPDISVVLSVRTTYVEYCLPDNFSAAEAHRIDHPGFTGCEEEAFLRYFSHFGIPPSCPVLQPEFSNPLFLKTFCEAVASNPRHVAEAQSSFSSLLNLYLASVNKRVADDLRCDPRDQPVQLAISRVADKLVQQGNRLIARSEAKAIIDAIHSSPDFSNSLYRLLLHEGILSETVVPNKDGSFHDYVRFSYERFGDFWLAQSMLRGISNRDAMAVRLHLQGMLQTVFGDERTRHRNASLLESLLILIAEEYQLEITELIEDVLASQSLTIATLASIPWRSRTGVSDRTERFVRDCVIREEYCFDALDCVLRMATRPNHRLNANWLHAWLLAMKMPDRDAIWSIYLHYRWQHNTSLRRIVDWAWIQNDQSSCPSVVRQLCGICLSWFFTSSNRYLRDRSTKALVSLYDNSVEEFAGILNLFQAVDDLYVLERVLAAACGLVMRSHESFAAKSVAKVVFHQVFGEGKPPAHILVRDYARMTVERANYLVSSDKFDSEKFSPPFSSKVTLSAQPWDSLKEEYSDNAYSALILSLWPEHGDFARYVLASGSTRGAHAWTSESDAMSLPNGESDLLKPFISDEGVDQITEFPDVDIEAEFYLESDLACRWIFERVLQLGWTASRFGDFDANMDSHGRDAAKPERMGKKYQWIAYHEWMAHVTDQRPFRSSSKIMFQYEGTWDTGLRDIDPTCLLRSTPCQSNLSKLPSPCWWADVEYADWRADHSDEEWMRNTEDLPPVHRLLNCEDPTTGTKYVSLEAHATWESNPPPGENRFDSQFRRIWYILQGYFLRSGDVSAFCQWASEQDFFGRWMPESHDTYGLYSCEFFWSPAYRDLDRSERNDAALRSDGSIRDHKLPCELVVPTTKFHWEGSGFDCSLDETISFMMPGIHLGEELNLSVGQDCGSFIDNAGARVAIDPSVHSPGPSTLLIEQTALQTFLQRKGYSLVWTFLGAKETLGRSIKPSGELRLNGIFLFDATRTTGHVSAGFQSFPIYSESGENEFIRRWEV